MTQVEAMFKRYGPKYRCLVTVTVMLGLIALGMSITIVNVAIPYIKGAFGMSSTEVQWLSTGFLAATCVTLLVAPWCIRSFGQRASYVGLLVVFIIGSFIGGFAAGKGEIVVARVIQGGMTGLIRPVALEALFAVFPPHKRGMATAMFGMSLALPLTLASVVGGWLVEHLSWPYVFFVMVPFAIAGIFLGSKFLPGREESGRRSPLDWVGAVASFIFIFALLATIANGQLWGWYSDNVIELGAIGLAAGAFFIWWELRSAWPLLDFAIFKYKEFVAGFIILLLFGGSFYVVMYILPLITQGILHYSPVTAGLMFVPSTVVLAMFVPLVGQLGDRMPAHWLSLPCVVVAGWGMYRMAGLDWDSSFSYLAVSMALLSIGMASIPALALTRSMAALPARLSAFGSGSLNLAVQLGGAFGTVTVVVLNERRTVLHSTRLTSGLTPGNATANEALKQLGSKAYGVGTGPVYHHAAAQYFLSKIDATWATIYAYHDVLLLVTAAVVLLAIPSYLLGRWGERLRRAQTR